MATKTSLLYEGKTKKIWASDEDGVFILENKPAITAMDDPERTRQFATKAISATTTTCQMFELLASAGIPVAFLRRNSETAFEAPACRMIPLEVVARRYAVGSYLKRHPELTTSDGEPPHRFHRLVTEFFLKTTGGKLVVDDNVVVDSLRPSDGEEDPLIRMVSPATWNLLHPKLPSWLPASLLLTLNLSKDPGLILRGQDQAMLDELVRKVFLVLEGAWQTLGYRLIDLKIEFGITQAGKLVVADVIDNDSWRLRTGTWEEVSKQRFRDGDPLALVEENYLRVAALTERLHFPQQAIIRWRGSRKDDLPEVGWNDIWHVNMRPQIENIVCSAHKSTRAALDHLEILHRQYPGGAVIIALVGMSNGLGPVLAAHTSWPVITVPTSLAASPHDIWSSLRMPSDVPMAVVASEENACAFALNILAARNPLLYMLRQLRIEELDTSY